MPTMQVLPSVRHTLRWVMFKAAKMNDLISKHPMDGIRLQSQFVQQTILSFSPVTSNVYFLKQHDTPITTINMC